jgi:hypothetical protein
MTGYYTLVKALKDHFDNDDLVNTVTNGDIFDVDIAKQTIFPLVHTMVTQAQFEARIQRFTLTIFAMDIVDAVKVEDNTKWETRDNTNDALNSTLQILNRAYQMLLHGALYDLNFAVENTPTCEPFMERFENNLVGWAMTIDIICPNEMTIC